MYVCMYVRTYVCMYVCMYAFMQAWLYVSTDLSKLACNGPLRYFFRIIHSAILTSASRLLIGVMQILGGPRLCKIYQCFQESNLRPVYVRVFKPNSLHM